MTANNKGSVKNVITIGPYASFIIDAKDISPLMAILERMTPVDRAWFEDGSAWVLEDQREINLVRDEKPVITKEEREVRREKDAETRKAREAAKEAANNGD